MLTYKKNYLAFILFTCLLIFGIYARSQTNLINDDQMSGDSLSVDHSQVEVIWKNYRPFSLSLPNEPTRPRSTSWPVVASFLLPGFDQWWEHQIQSGIFYSGMGYIGLRIAGDAYDKLKRRDAENNTDPNKFDSMDSDVKQLFWGAQLYQTAGSLSAYHSFRTAVRSRKPYGEFSFLTHEETTGDILEAPLHLSYLKRPTTYWPLGVLAVLAMSDVFSSSQRRVPSAADTFYSLAISYNAGTGEEAIFRGWMMPDMMNGFQSEFWSNFTTATLFSLAHYSSSNRFPLAQFLLGGYFGWLTQKNEWQISEGVFIHTWWDVLVFTSVVAKGSEEMVYLPLGYFTF